MKLWEEKQYKLNKFPNSLKKPEAKKSEELLAKEHC